MLSHRMAYLCSKGEIGTKIICHLAKAINVNVYSRKALIACETVASHFSLNSEFSGDFLSVLSFRMKIQIPGCFYFS